MKDEFMLFAKDEFTGSLSADFDERLIKAILINDVLSLFGNLERI